jgi:hypothetical protein
MVTERLARAIEHIDELPEEEQDAIADQIEAFRRAHAGDSQSRPSLAGVWSDLPDDMEETLLRWRIKASQIAGSHSASVD